MPKAIWNNQVIAEVPVNEIEHAEGNVYFPLTTVKHDYLRPSDTHTTCPWKSIASYYDVVVDGQVNDDAAWYYPDPYSLAANLRNHIAFWHGVKVEE
jgi:uncharacterized protein (DUF427 family)